MFPASTAVTFLAFLPLHRVKFPNVQYSNAEDISAKHSDFRSKTKTLQPVLHDIFFVVILYPATRWGP